MQIHLRLRLRYIDHLLKDTMEIFVKAKQLLHIFGFSIVKGSASSTDIIRRVISITIVVCQAVSTFWFVAFKAQAFAEIGSAILVMVNAIIILLQCLFVLSRTNRIADLIENCCEVFQRRMYQSKSD